MSESFFREEPEPQPTEPRPEPDISLSEEPQPAAEDLPNEDDRLAAAMSYIPFLCFVPLMNVNWRNNPRARFHARQGVLLFVIELVTVLLLIDDLAKFALRAILILTAALAVAGIILASQGKSLRLPFISDLANKLRL